MSRLVDLQIKRFKQLFGITSIAMTVLAFNALLKGIYFDAIALFFAIGVIAGLVLYIRSSEVKVRVGAVFTSIITLLVLAIMWTSNGIKDNAMFALPVILMFTALTGSRSWFYVLLIVMAINMMTMGILGHLGIFEPRPATHSLSSAFDLTLILLLTGYAVHILMTDNLGLVNELEEEIQHANTNRDKLAYAAYHDALTGLPNRSMAATVFKDVLERTRRSRKTAVFLYIDLDDFKSVNDIYGHTQGDIFLQNVSLRLRSEMRQTDCLFRIGGDEFLILLEGFKTEDDIVTVVDKLVTAISKPIPVSNTQVSCTPSIGIVKIPDDATDFETATKRADMSMYKAKADAAKAFYFYDAQSEELLLQKYELEKDFSNALDNKELTVHFQPIIQLEDSRPAGAEALIRWQHADKGFISPETFIPIAEKLGVIDRLTRFVIEESCDLILAIKHDNPDFYVSVNITPTQLQQPNLCKRISNQMNLSCFKNLKFEVTESHFFEDINLLRTNVNEVRKLGVEFYLDDFGTGYSNVGHLQKLAFQTLKIDRTFTNEVNRKPESEQLIHGIALMSKRLGLDIVAEGVETKEEANTLYQLGIERAQGYLWSKPIEANAFLTYFREPK